MHSPLDTFAGLLDRSVREIAALAADTRAFDADRIGRIADIWDNNTFPLVSAACAVRPLRARRARAGLQWMAGLGATRRALMVDLDPALDSVLAAAAPEQSVHRDYRDHVSPGRFSVTAQTVTSLDSDYDLPAASVRSLAVRPAATGLQVQVTLAAPRRFTPSTGCVAPDGSRKPWPPAPLHFTFEGVTDLRFDAADRVGLGVTCGDAGPTVVIGQYGGLQATCASVWPHDPRWYESAAGRAADAVTPYERPRRPEPVRTSLLTSHQQAAARALVMLMLHIRLVSYYPDLAARVPVGEICNVLGDAGSAILAAAADHGRARRQAFTELAQRWRHAPPDVEPAVVPSGTAMLRYASFHEPHKGDDVARDGSAVLVAAVPQANPEAPWRLVSEQVDNPARFRIAAAAFDGVQDLHRDAGTLTSSDALTIQRQ